MSLTTEAIRTLERIPGMTRMVRSVETHLLADQAEAVAPGHSNGGSGSSDISDPTFGRIAALAPYAGMERSILARVRAVGRALDELDDELQRVLSKSAAMLNGKPGQDEPRCPGWSDERRARLGGCGNHLATYKDGKGNDHVRPEYLCHSCLKEKRADERAGEVA